ncbi:MAG: chromosome segregation protein SMC [Bifidobacteriaceae bacterium]|jgi:chromosome segregation protein|nr:chromosome segregation protein SMC [Bifidobacteriaceae bacterium]
MFLKSLKLKGFKSFAQTTTLNFAQGVSCVVGPNGSGKSNILDAIEWCLGEQGTKNLRANSMEDVIFFGSKGRDKLGRADVICTFDNSDNKIPLQFSEVEIRRVLFRDGNSQYYLNGEQVRLNYIQKLLSKAGLGKQMHIIVGQGKLDSVLSAPPDKRRAFIEEAAGILDYRYRKVKTTRQLDNILLDMTRLNDIIEEIKKQATPLKRQAKIASQSQTLKDESRRLQATLLLDNYYAVKNQLDRIDKSFDNKTVLEKGLLDKIAKQRQLVLELESQTTGNSSEVKEINSVWHQLISLAEKYRSFINLSYEKSKLNSTRPFIPESKTDKSLFSEIEKAELDLKKLLDKYHTNETKIASQKAKIETLSLALDDKDTQAISVAKAVLPKVDLQKWLKNNPKKSLSELDVINKVSQYSQLAKAIFNKFFIFDKLAQAKEYLSKNPQHFAVLANGDILINSNMFSDFKDGSFEFMQNVKVQAQIDLQQVKAEQTNLSLLISQTNKILGDLKAQTDELTKNHQANISKINKNLKAGISQAQTNLSKVENRIVDIEKYRSAIMSSVTLSDSNISKVRREIDLLNQELTEHRQGLHKTELQKQQLQITINQLRSQAVENLSATVEDLDKEIIQINSDLSFPLDVQAKHDFEINLDKLAVKLAQLGKVNPLALEEYELLQDRYNYLSKQYDDLDKTRLDLKKIIVDLTKRIDTAFQLAFQDTAKEFEIIFKDLFPGGTGKLVLVDTDNGQGIDVKASPEGKKLISLSLMSGGERSLIALAMLVAIFKARPSPFYILDEVEAALDDINLQRVLKLFNSLKHSGQLIIITHQKSTMEVADTLYGVTMRGDGISKVITHKIDKNS